MTNIKEIRERCRNYAKAELGEIEQFKIERMIFPSVTVEDADTIDDFDDLPVVIFRAKVQRNSNEYFIFGGGTIVCLQKTDQGIEHACEEQKRFVSNYNERMEDKQDE